MSTDLFARVVSSALHDFKSSFLVLALCSFFASYHYYVTVSWEIIGAMLTSILDSEPTLHRGTKVSVGLAYISMLHGNPRPEGGDSALLYRHRPRPTVALLYALD